MKNTFLVLLILAVIMSCKTTALSTITEKVENNDVDLQLVTDLNPKITETSGLEYFKDLIITHHDSGDTPTLYFLNNQGAILYSKTYKNMNATDWEDITKDDKFLYIADTGNNYGNRKDLTIYKIALSDLDNENAPVEKLNIKYKEQKNFLKGNQDHPYDAESLVAIENQIYIFSKDWKDQTTVIYQIDKSSKSQTLTPITSHNVKGLITGATFNGKDTVMLCGYNSSLTPFIIPVHYQNGQFLFKEKQELQINGGAQVEAINYYKTDKNQDVYYLSSEAVNIKLGDDEAQSNSQLYKMKIPRTTGN